MPHHGSHRDSIRRVRSARPHLGADEIARLLGCHRSTVWRCLRRDAVIRMARCSPNLTGRQIAARCDVGPQFVQDHLAWAGRRDVAWGMAMGASASVRAARRSLSQPALRRFMQHPDPAVRAAAVSNPCSDRAVLVAAGRDADAAVRAVLAAADSRCPWWLLLELAADRDRAVASAASQNPRMSAPAPPRRHGRCPDPGFRLAAARHPNIAAP